MRWYRRYDELIGTESDRRANVRLIYPVNGQEPVALGRSAQWYTGTSLCCLLRPNNCLRLAFIRLRPRLDLKTGSPGLLHQASRAAAAAA